MGYDDNFYQHDGDVRSRGKISGFMWTGSEGSGFGALASQDPSNFTIVAEEGITIVEMINDPHDGVPKDGTALLHTYWDIPKDNNSYMLVGFERTLGKGIEPYVHHTLLYGCSEPQPANHTPGPRREAFCSEILFVFDAGEDADKKFGVKVCEGTNIQSFRVEVHYDVPIGNAVHSARDPGTGYYLRLAIDDGTYTPIGTMTTGTFAISIPGQSPRTSPDSHFWGECVVGDVVGPDSINILFNIFHQHLVGRTMWATVERKGDYGNTIEMARQNYYDWNFQGATFVGNGTMKVYLGDIIRTHCVYDTTGRWNFNKHGELFEGFCHRVRGGYLQGDVF